MAKRFAGFTPEQMGKIVPEMQGMQGDEQVKFLAANPAAAARVGKMAEAAQKRIGMAYSGMVKPKGYADGGQATLDAAQQKYADAQNALTIIKVTSISHAVIFIKKLSVFRPQNFVYFSRLPHIKQALPSFTICILCAVKSSFRIRHITQHIIKNFAGDFGIIFLACHLVSLNINFAQKCLVIEHFLKVRNEPA